jgi:hypothetical protein
VYYLVSTYFFVQKKEKWAKLIGWCPPLSHKLSNVPIITKRLGTMPYVISSQPAREESYCFSVSRGVFLWALSAHISGRGFLMGDKKGSSCISRAVMLYSEAKWNQWRHKCFKVEGARTLDSNIRKTGDILLKLMNLSWSNFFLEKNMATARCSWFDERLKHSMEN